MTSDDDYEFDFEPILRTRDAERAAERRRNPPVRKNHSVCPKYLQGLCMLGDDRCQFLHVLDESRMPICRFFLKNCCTRGARCAFSHRYTHRQVRTQCALYKQGFCPLGPKCDSLHIKRSHMRASVPMVPTRGTRRVRRPRRAARDTTYINSPAEGRNGICFPTIPT